MPRFRVMLMGPGFTIWTEPIPLMDAYAILTEHEAVGVAGTFHVETRSLAAKVAAYSLAADPADRGMMTVGGCACGRCAKPRAQARFVRMRHGMTAASPQPASHLPGQESLPTWDEAHQPPPAELVTGKEQLAAALAVPSDSVIEIPKVPAAAAKHPTAEGAEHAEPALVIQPLLAQPAAAALLAKAKALCLALLGIPQGKGTP